MTGEQKHTEALTYSVLSGSKAFYDKKLITSNIAMINFSGVMYTDDQYCGPRGIRSITEQLYAAYGDPSVNAILLIANTPGGQASAAKILRSAILDKNKPVVVFSQLLASGGVWATVDADEIVADIGSQFGSIGAYMSFDKEMVKYYIENIDDIYATQSEEKNYDIRQYMAGNKDPLQKTIDSLAKDFINLVKPKMKGTEENISKMLKGGMFPATFAKSVGLVSRIGTRNAAIERAVILSNVYKNQ